MTERLGDTWDAREYPVLRETARLLEIDDTFAGVRLHDIATATGFEPETVLRSLRILEHAGLVDLHLVMPAIAGRVTQIAPEARQLVGQWPTAETALDRVIAALEAIAENTEDEEERTKAQRFAAWLRSGATTVGLSVASAAITGQLPGAGS
jgi:predicted ArsR family transcriptional regulator